MRDTPIKPCFDLLFDIVNPLFKKETPFAGSTTGFYCSNRFNFKKTLKDQNINFIQTSDSAYGPTNNIVKAKEPKRKSVPIQKSSQIVDLGIVKLPILWGYGG